VRFNGDAPRRCLHDTRWWPKPRRPTLANHGRQVLELARTRNETVTQPLPQAGRATIVPTPAEAALVLVRAMRCMLRRTTPGNENCYTALQRLNLAARAARPLE
jgi:hypothetical protein